MDKRSAENYLYSGGMTTEQAIENLKEIKSKYTWSTGADDALDMAIKALKQELKKCKDCKWWKDSDGAFRRGIGAESKCPINRQEVYEGNGYCYIFETQESEE